MVGKLKLIKAGLILLVIIIVGVVSILLLDPGNDLYNNYNTLYSSTQDINSKSKFIKEYNYVLEKDDTGSNGTTGQQKTVTYLNQGMGGMVGQIGGWEGSNDIAGKSSGIICVQCSGCGPTSLSEFELQQGKVPELGRPDLMLSYLWDKGWMAKQGTGQNHNCGRAGNNRQATAGQWDLVKNYAIEKGYKYETLPQDCWGNKEKTKEWYIGHLQKGHWVVNLLGTSQGANGHGTNDKSNNRVFKTNGHFVAFYGVSENGDAITYDVGSSSRNGVPISWDDIWHDSRPVKGEQTRAAFMTAIWNEDFVSSGGSNSGSTGTTGGLTTDGELKLKETMKFADRVWRKGAFQEMTCYAFKSTSTTKKNFTVFVDAGHGSDPLGMNSKDEFMFPTGNDGVGGAGVKGEGFQGRSTGESEFNIDLALKIKDLLLAEGYDVVMSRTGADRRISNGGVGIMASETSDILISIHWNGSPASSAGQASGTITFYTDKTATSSAGYDYSKMPSEWGSDDQMAKSRELAEMVTSSIVNETQLKRNGTGTRSEYQRVLGYSTIPSVLVETGFGDNTGDRVILDNNRDEIAKAYVNGINQYYNKYK